MIAMQTPGILPGWMVVIPVLIAVALLLWLLFDRGIDDGVHWWEDKPEPGDPIASLMRRVKTPEPKRDPIIYTGVDAPTATAVRGDVWADPALKVTHVFDGARWVEVRP